MYFKNESRESERDKEGKDREREKGSKRERERWKKDVSYILYPTYVSELEMGAAWKLETIEKLCFQLCTFYILPLVVNWRTHSDTYI